MEFRQPCDNFIHSRLLSDSALVALVGGSSAPRIYNADLVPQSATYPMVTYSPLSLLNRAALPATEILFAMPVYWIRAVITGRDMTPAYTIVRRINAALIKQSGNVTVSGETYYFGPWFWRTTRTLPPETEGTLSYLTHGIEAESRVEFLG